VLKWSAVVSSPFELLLVISDEWDALLLVRAFDSSRRLLTSQEIRIRLPIISA
jgi:hypothetical protein